MPGLHWLAARSVDGSIIAELPNLTVDQELTQIISKYQAATVSLPMVGTPGPPKNWMRATQSYATTMVALDDNNNPLWGGIVQQRPRGTGPVMKNIPLATAESYLTRRFIRDHLQYPSTTWGACQVGVDLLNKYVVDDPGGYPGLPMRVVMLDPGPPAGDRDWQDSDDKSIYSAFGDLGFEWAITWEWQHNPERLTPVMTLGSRIGQPVTPGRGPTTSFDFPANCADVSSIDGDYTDGKGANEVMSTSDGSGKTRPQSDHQVAADFGERLTVELRRDAGTSIDKLAVLNADAAATLAAVQDGSSSITIVAQHGTSPAFGDRWNIGDDIGYSITGAPQYPDNPSGLTRAIGVSFTDNTFSPILAGQAA